jgi:tetratricopeptide (TPR) repeat protein
MKKIILLLLSPLLILSCSSKDNVLAWEINEVDVIQRARFSSKDAEAQYINLLTEARAKAKQNLFSEAELAHDNAIKINPYYATAYADRGNLMALIGEYGRANQDYATFISLTNPKNGYALNQVYLLWLQLGSNIDQKLFFSTLEKSIKNNHPEKNTAQTIHQYLPHWVLKGHKLTAYLHLNDYQKAINASQELLQLKDSNSDSFGYLGLSISYSKMGKTEKACSFGKQIKDPTFVAQFLALNICPHN